MKGKLIVFEGTDGSGKATQSRLLRERLERAGLTLRHIDFPRYGKPSAAMVEEYLGGKLGKKAEDVNAYAASMFYAMDRFASYKQDWGEHYDAGGLVIADRYTTSNAVHQASKLEGDARKEYLDWLYHTEYGLFGLPKPDLVIYLDMPTEISERMMRAREESTNTSADIHEKDKDYLKRCRANAKEIVKDSGWVVVDCAAGDAPRSIEDIHEEVWRIAASIL